MGIKSKIMKFLFLIMLGSVSSIFAQEKGIHTQVVRLNDGKAIIDKAWFERQGITDSDADNINGASLIRIPDWLTKDQRADPSAQYYLYFSHHQGNYIRMAWSSSVLGPYTLFNAGNQEDPSFPGKGVLDLGPEDKMEWVNGAKMQGHVASPHVLLDSINQQFILFIHAPSNGKGSSNFSTESQKTFIGVSHDGLNFNGSISEEELIGGVGRGPSGFGMVNQILANAYLKTFEYQDELYGFTNHGVIWKSPSKDKPWNTANSPIQDAWEEGKSSENPVFLNLKVIKTVDSTRKEVSTPRHFTTRMRNDGHTLEVWYTSRGDAPERIFRTTMDLRGNWMEWKTTLPHEEMLRPELDWEGVNLPVQASKNGAENQVNQLRDPELFQDVDGKWYLLYSGGGEDAIGIAAVIDN